MDVMVGNGEVVSENKEGDSAVEKDEDEVPVAGNFE